MRGFSPRQLIVVLILGILLLALTAWRLLTIRERPLEVFCYLGENIAPSVATISAAMASAMAPGSAASRMGRPTTR